MLTDTYWRSKVFCGEDAMVACRRKVSSFPQLKFSSFVSFAVSVSTIKVFIVDEIIS